MAKSRVNEIWEEYENASGLEGKQREEGRVGNNEETRKAIVKAFLLRIDPLIKNLDKGEIEELLLKTNKEKEKEAKREVELILDNYNDYLLYYGRCVNTMKEDLNILIDRALDLLMGLKNVIGEDAFAEQSLSGKALIEKVDLSFSNDLMSKFLSAAESLSAIYKSEGDWRDKYSEIKKNLEWTDNAVLEHGRYIDGQVNLVIQWLETVISIMEESLKPRNTLWGRFSRKPSFDLKNYNNGISFLKKRLGNFKSCEEIFLNKKKLSDFHGYDFRRGRYNG